MPETKQQKKIEINRFVKIIYEAKEMLPASFYEVIYDTIHQAVTIGYKRGWADNGKRIREEIFNDKK